MVTNALLIPNEQILTNSTDSYMIPGNNNFPNPAGRPTVSVIIPTLNEAKNIPYILPFLPMEWIDEVILVDGRSSDDTIEVARQILPSVKIVLEQRKGKGIAMQAGYKAAQGDIIVMVDADGSNDPREIPSFILKLMEGADFVKGTRFAPGGGTTDMTRIRKMGNWGFVILCNMIFSQSFTDLAYGYHAFWSYCLDDLDLEEFDGFEIDTGLYLQAVRKNMRLVEVPSFEGYRFFGEGKLRTIPDGFRVLKTIFKEWQNSFRDEDTDIYVGFRGAKPSMVRKNFQCIRLLSLLLVTGYNLEAAMKSLLQMSIQRVGASSASIMVVDNHGNLKDSRLVFNGEIMEPQTPDLNDVIQDGLAGWVLQNRQPALVSNTVEDHRWIKRDWDRCTQCARSAMALPLILNGQVLGVITLAQKGINAFSEKDLAVLQEMAQIA